MRLRGWVASIVWDLDPRPVELLAAQLSLWFAWALTTTTTTSLPVPLWFWSLWALTAAVCKIIGVLPTLTGLNPPHWLQLVRGLGCLLGFFFWGVLSGVFLLLSPGGVGWGAFGIVGLAQGWAFYRVARKRVP